MSNTSRQRWERGDCPCCGWMDADEPWDWDGETTSAEAIGEGVMVCGRCVANCHLDDRLIRAMLEDIARPEREAVEELIASVKQH